MKNIGKLYVFILSGMLLVGCGKQTQSYLEVTQESEEHFETEEADTQTVQAKEEDGHILIYVCGEVNFPGVYELPAGSRIVDAVDAAGGLTDEAGQDYWNLAELLTDGQMICFPTEEEARERQESAGVAGTSGAGVQEDGRVNINTATLEQLMQLPGVGQTRGEAIIAYRQEHGDFSSAEDIMNVSGIGSALYEKMKDYITVK